MKRYWMLHSTNIHLYCGKHEMASGDFFKRVSLHILSSAKRKSRLMLRITADYWARDHEL
jgi:hypothetical protein